MSDYSFDDNTQKVLDLLQEECAEIIQIISKIRRFGFGSYNPYDPEPRKTNLQLLNDELGDFKLLYDQLLRRGVVDEDQIDKRVKWKRQVHYNSSLFCD